MEETFQESVITSKGKKKQLIERNRKIKKMGEKAKSWNLSTTPQLSAEVQAVSSTISQRTRESCTSQSSSMNINPNRPT